ncbi:hypothetical protein PRIPAC_75715 [Pristionchus pacificus]|uniref:Uncharacterized protein n=1 Tax=Pristionchus pacificus TaxID=54126 RepID=A0A2A6C7G7_PRIPA|nr:hypothetical protein PRIPAC_75715 [Pristionchus pacificus]|eukprot:PDM73981.1 hypothetical protein PRIPAC_41337 [Pristionchus pacificus]
MSVANSIVSSLLLFFLALPGRSSGYDCHWLGTAPICDYGSCPSGYEFMIKATSASDTQAFGEFGSSCLMSTSVERDGKLLCCSDNDAAKIKDQFNVCEWRGTAPVCGWQECRAGFTEVLRSGDVTVASKDGIFPTAAGFGLPCMQGYKTLCCKHSANPQWERSCEWAGRAPLCGRNDCPRFPPKVEFGRATGEENGQIADFGSSCMWGSKTLCCNPK